MDDVTKDMIKGTIRQKVKEDRQAWQREDIQRVADELFNLIAAYEGDLGLGGESLTFLVNLAKLAGKEQK